MSFKQYLQKEFAEWLHGPHDRLQLIGALIALSGSFVALSGGLGIAGLTYFSTFGLVAGVLGGFAIWAVAFYIVVEYTEYKDTQSNSDNKSRKDQQ